MELYLMIAVLAAVLICLVILLLQNRRISLGKRIFLLYKALSTLDSCWKTLPMDALTAMTADISACEEEIPLPAHDSLTAMAIQTELTEWFIANCRSIEDYGEEALAALNIPEENRDWCAIARQYADAARHLDEVFPNLEIMLEQKLRLGEMQLMLPQSMTDHEIELEAELTTGAAGEDEHTHALQGMLKLQWKNALRSGDHVLLLRVPGGQKYIVLDRVME